MQGDDKSEREKSSPPGWAYKRFLLEKMWVNMWTAEWRVDGYDLCIRNFRFVPHHGPVDGETASYLLKCCFRVNEFFPGAFEIKVDAIPDLPDETVIGTHALTGVCGVGDINPIKALIAAGKFDPGTF